MPHASLAVPPVDVKSAAVIETGVAEYVNPVMAERSHPSIFLVGGQVEIVGAWVSSICRVCVHVLELPQPSLRVKVRVTMIGHEPVWLSI